jgi:hypothetical protein
MMTTNGEDIARALETSAAAYASGDTEAGFHQFVAVRGSLASLPPLDGWPAKRLAILSELDAHGRAFIADRPLFDALARAALADDTGPLDDLVDRRMRGGGTAPGVDAFDHTPNLQAVYRSAFDFAYTRQRVRNQARMGVVIALVILAFIARRIVLALLR